MVDLLVIKVVLDNEEEVVDKVTKMIFATELQCILGQNFYDPKWLLNFAKNFVIDIECDYHKNLIEDHQFQLRYLQTLNSISAEHNSTIIFPVPIGKVWDVNDKRKNIWATGDDMRNITITMTTSAHRYGVRC